MSSFFDIETVCFTLWNYPLSWVECIATLFGLLSVYFATKMNILTWSTGIVNEIFLFLLFYQVHLYADMCLQLYFFVVTLYGWYSWKNDHSVKTISGLSNKRRILLIAMVLLSSLLSGIFFSKIHLLLLQYFNVAAAYPYADSFILCASIFATVLLARKKIENWLLWICINVVSIVVYALKGVYFLSLEYLIFLLMAIYGYRNWQKTKKANG